MAQKNLILVVCAILILPACSWQTAADTSELREAQSMLDQFLLRHGFTEAGHPDDLPVQHVSLWDGLSDDEELKKNRKATLSGPPFCVLKPAEYPYAFVFRTEEGSTAISISIEADGSGWVHEANPIVTRRNCMRLPDGRSGG